MAEISTYLHKTDIVIFVYGSRDIDNFERSKIWNFSYIADI